MIGSLAIADFLVVLCTVSTRFLTRGHWLSEYNAGLVLSTFTVVLCTVFLYCLYTVSTRSSTRGMAGCQSTMQDLYCQHSLLYCVLSVYSEYKVTDTWNGWLSEYNAGLVLSTFTVVLCTVCIQ